MSQTLVARPPVGTRSLVVAAILALPLVPYAYLHAPVGHSVVRYSVEGIVDAAALAAFAVRPRRVLRRLGPLLAVVAGLVAFWLLTDAWNAVSLRTAVVAGSADLRFFPVVVLLAAADRPLRGSDLYLRALYAGAAIQSVLAVLFAVHATTLQTTLGDRNRLGVYLMLAAVLLAASYERLERRLAVALAVLLAAGIVAAASREAAIGLLLGLLVIGYLRFGRRGRQAVVAVAAVSVLVFLLPTILGRGSGVLDSKKVSVRWQQLFNANLSPSTDFRVRLLVENAKLVARTQPVLGVGFGTASAPAVVVNLTSPVYRSFHGYDLASQIEPFVYDSNWAIIVLETGFLGAALLAGVFAYLTWVGIRGRSLWYGRGLAAIAPAVAVTCFAAPILREATSSLVLWLLAGLTTLALRAEPVRELEPAVQPVALHA